MLLSLLSLSSLACPPPPPWDLHHPKSWQEAHPDSVIWLTEHSGGPWSWSLLDEAGQPVPLAEHRIGALLGLYPDEPLAPGLYQLLGDDGGPIPAGAELQVVDGAEPVADPPGATRRHRYHDYVYPDPGHSCYLDTPQTGVSYSVCGEHVVTLFAVGPDEPPSPLDEPDGVQVSWSGPIGLGGEPGDVTRVWIGGLDGAGRFTGWIPDDVTLPLPGFRLEEVGEAPRPDDCTEPGPWVIETRFLSVELAETRSEVFPRFSPSAGIGGGESTTPDPLDLSCSGCRTSPAVGVSFGLWFLLGLLRRSHSRSR